MAPGDLITIPRQITGRVYSAIATGMRNEELGVFIQKLKSSEGRPGTAFIDFVFNEWVRRSKRKLPFNTFHSIEIALTSDGAAN